MYCCNAMSHLRAVCGVEGYLSEAAVGIFIGWAAIRTVAAARLLLLI